MASKRPLAHKKPEHSDLLTLTNAGGQRLHIKNPEIHTEQELQWLRDYHDARSPCDPFKIVGKEMQVPKNTQTAVIDRSIGVIHQALQDGISYQAPLYYREEMARLEKAAEKQQERWQPEPKG